MGLFDLFTKKKPHYDPNNIMVSDMRTGFVFDYDLKSWEVVQTFEYQWQDNSVSLEFTIDNGEEQRFLSVDDDDGLFITLMEKTRIRLIDEDLPDYILRHETPPKTINYKGRTYYLDDESVGVCYEEGEKEGSDLISWEYYDETEKYIICIEQWGENDFDASYGIVVKDFEFSNILPSSS